MWLLLVIFAIGLSPDVKNELQRRSKHFGVHRGADVFTRKDWSNLQLISLLRMSIALGYTIPVLYRILRNIG